MCSKNIDLKYEHTKKCAKSLWINSYPCNITNSSFEKVPTHQGLLWPSVWSLALPDSVVHIPPKVQDVLKVSNNTLVKSCYVNE